MAIIIIAAVIFLSVIFIIKNIYTSIYTPKGTTRISPQPKEKNIYSILLLGLAGGTHDGPFLTDTMMVFSVDLKQKKVLLISIPRDLWVKLPTKSGLDLHTKINTVYQRELFIKESSAIDPAYVGNNEDAELVKFSVSQITGLPIDYYAAIDFSGFIKAIDLIGGVDIIVPKSFDDPDYPIEGKENELCGQSENDIPELEKIATSSPSLAYPCRYELLHFDGGKNHMDGVRALKFVRSRHSKQDGTDFGRAQRQQLLLEAVKEKLFSITYLPKILPFLTEMTKYIKTDIDLQLFQTFIREANNQKLYSLVPIVISDKNFVDVSYSSDGQYILIPKVGMDNWTQLSQGIKQTFEATPLARPTTALIPTSK